MSDFRFPDSAEREKRARLLTMLDTGKVMVYVDPRRPGVDLPRQFNGQVAVPLNLSHRFGLDVFEVGPLAVRANLSFGGQRHLCVLPYRAIFGLYGHADGSRVLFADALPPEVAVVEQDAREHDEAPEQAPPPAESPPTPPADPAGADGPSPGERPTSSGAAGEGADGPGKSPSGPPFLRLVE